MTITTSPAKYLILCRKLSPPLRTIRPATTGSNHSKQPSNRAFTTQSTQEKPTSPRSRTSTRPAPLPSKTMITKTICSGIVSLDSTTASAFRRDAPVEAPTTTMMIGSALTIKFQNPHHYIAALGRFLIPKSRLLLILSSKSV